MEGRVNLREGIHESGSWEENPHPAGQDHSNQSKARLESVVSGPSPVPLFLLKRVTGLGSCGHTQQPPGVATTVRIPPQRGMLLPLIPITSTS